MKIQKSKRCALLGCLGVWMFIIMISGSVFGQMPDDPGFNQRDRSVRSQRPQPKEVRARHMGPVTIEIVARHLPGITQEQTDQIRKIHLEFGKQSLTVKNELGEKRARLRSVSTGEGVSLSKINVVIDDIGGLLTQLMKINAAEWQAFRKVLTEEQRNQVDQRHHIPYGSKDGFQEPGRKQMRFEKQPE